MKKSYRIFPLLILIFSCVCMQSIQAQSIKKVTKTISKTKWYIDFEAVMKIMPKEMQEDFETILGEKERKKLKQEMENQRYWFKKNYEYEVLNSVNGTEKGTWSVMQKQNFIQIKMKDNSEQITVFKLNFFSKKKIILVPENDENSAQLILLKAK